jgi:stage V sporulation protein B
MTVAESPNVQARSTGGVVARGALYTMLSRVAFILSGYAIHFSMAYLLLPAEYGELGVIIGLITLWRVFLSAGLPQTTSQFIAGDEQRAHGIWRQALKIQMLAALLLWVVYALGTPLWTLLLNDRSLTTDILISSFLIPFMAWYQINLGYYLGRLQFGRQAFYATFYAVARVVLAIVLAVIGLRIHGAVLGMTLAVLAVALLTHLGVPKEPAAAVEPPDWRRLVGFSLPLILVSLGISALLNLDLLMLQRFFPDSEMIGFYNGAVNLGKSPYFLLASFATTVLPSVARELAAGNQQAAQRLVSKHTTYVLLISLPCAALVAASAAKLLDFVYPAQYQVAGPPLAILIFSMSGLALLSVLTSALTAAGKPRAAMLIVLGCVLLQMALGTLLIPRYQMMGTAVANLLTLLFGLLSCSVLVKKAFGVLLDLGRVLKATAISLVLGVAFSLWQSYPLILLPVLYTVGLGLYGAGMLALGAVTPSERAMLKRALGRLGLARPSRA